MNTKEIKAVFDRTFNGMPNPIFCNPYSYFEHNGYLCELASSESGLKMAKRVKSELYKTPLAIFDMALADCGNWLTVLTMDGERTQFGGHFDTEEEFNELMEEIK